MPDTDFSFDRAIYTDATSAGLAVLIPIPGLDWLVEEFFRRRMPAAIANQRGQTLSRPVIKELNKTEGGCLKSCLLGPFIAVFWLLKKLSRKIVYFLTVKEATDQISLYWHRAFLIDYMLAAGHLDEVASAATARRAMQRVLDTTHRGPLRQVAAWIVGRPHRVFRALGRLRGDQEEILSEEQRSQIQSQWAKFKAYFNNLAALYDQAYEAEQRFQQQLAADQTSSRQ